MGTDPQARHSLKVDPLATVRKAAKGRTTANSLFREAITRAVLDGCTLRAVAGAAGISHSRVIQIVREAQAREEGGEE